MSPSAGTPRPRAVFRLPRALKEPACCSDSSFSITDSESPKSPGVVRSTGVRRRSGVHRSTAAAISALVGTGIVVMAPCLTPAGMERTAGNLRYVK